MLDDIYEEANAALERARQRRKPSSVLASLISSLNLPVKQPTFADQAGQFFITNPQNDFYTPGINGAPPTQVLGTKYIRPDGSGYGQVNPLSFPVLPNPDTGQYASEPQYVNPTVPLPQVAPPIPSYKRRRGQQQ